jgi:DNA-binding NarL/FixJ family response regulator
MTAPIRVLVADDHPPTRAGVCSALLGTEFVVVAEAFTSSTAVHEAVRMQPDVCLIDVHMPGGGVAAVSDIVRLVPRTAVIMLSVSDSPDDLLASLRVGARGYLLKTIDPDRLAPALRGAISGEAPIPRTLVTHMVDAVRGNEQGKGQVKSALTLRESQIFDLVKRGLSTAEIAQHLYIAPGTVRSHLMSAIRKTGTAKEQAG